MLYNDIKELVKNRILNYRLPVTSFDFSKRNIFCDMDGCTREHPMRIEYRYCCQVDSCPVKYKISFCEIIERYNLMQKANHIHTINDAYNNLKGVDQFWYNDLLEYAKKDITAPKRIHSDLTDEYGKRIRVNDEGEVVDFETEIGDIIPFPSREQIRNFINNNKNHKTKKSESNNLDLIVEYVNNNTLKEECMKNKEIMFFFSINKNNEDKIVVGTGNDNEHFYICATSLALLNNCDASNQNHITMYGIDGTYKIFKEKFTLVAFGRLDL